MSAGKIAVAPGLENQPPAAVNRPAAAVVSRSNGSFNGSEPSSISESKNDSSSGFECEPIADEEDTQDEERNPNTGHYDRAEPPKPCEIIHNSVTEAIAASNPEDGVLIPQRTTLEVNQNSALLDVWITRVPAKCTNDTLQALEDELGAGTLPYFLHLRRCAKPGDLPSHLKTRFMNESAVSRVVHTGKAHYIYIIVGPKENHTAERIQEVMSKVPGVDEGYAALVAVPEHPPTSQVQAAGWSMQFWPTVYRKNNPLGPHPGLVTRATQEIYSDAKIWMNLAFKVARSVHQQGAGEPIGTVIVWRENGKATVVGVAGDARWRNIPIRNERGNCMAHASMRAISMVAQKLVRVERKAKGLSSLDRTLSFDPFQDTPFLPEEKAVYEDEHPTPNGYLCHGLELYTTHEPCIQCSMAILHSRMGKVVYCHRMPLAGGMCSWERNSENPELEGEQNGAGLGLFWRKELNWSLLCWKWEPPVEFEDLPELPLDMEA